MTTSQKYISIEAQNKILDKLFPATTQHSLALLTSVLYVPQSTFFENVSSNCSNTAILKAQCFLHFNLSFWDIQKYDSNFN